MPPSAGQAAPARSSGASGEEVPSTPGAREPLGGSPLIALAVAVGATVALFWLLMRIRKAFVK